LRLNWIDERLRGCTNHSTDSQPFARTSANVDSMRSRASAVCCWSACTAMTPPDQQSPNDLRHLVEPFGGTSDIERLELLGVAFLSVTNDHASGDSIAAIGPSGVHAFPVGVGPERSRPPSARLRFGSTPGASNADESRWMVDQRASSRPFSILEMSAWEKPACSASSACVHPSSIRRSRIDSPGRVSRAKTAKSVTGRAYVSSRICRTGRRHLGLPEQSSRTVTLTATLQMVCVRPRSAPNWAYSCSVGIPRRSAQVVRLVRVVRNCSSSAEGRR